MVQNAQTLAEVMDLLGEESCLSVDTETTGLRPFHGDRFFSVIIGTRTKGEFYFSLDDRVHPFLITYLRVLFRDEGKTWFMHNAKFDLAFLKKEGIEVHGKVHCTRAIARVVRNDHHKYDLSSCSRRIGLEKSEAVEEYIKEHKLWAWREIPGKNKRVRDKFYDRIPLDVIVPYGERDANITLKLGLHQIDEIERKTLENPGLPSLRNVMLNERRLTKTIFRMEQVGVKIDRDYCMRAARYELDRAGKARLGFKSDTGEDFRASGKLFENIFGDERDLWEYTDKGNPSFESDVIKKFSNPAARRILEYRDAKSKSDFYNGFLYHADNNDVVHPNFNPDGAATGRFTSSEPNFQNLTNEEDEEEQEFVIRRAIVPRPGFVFIMPDYDQMEYRMMFDYAAMIVGVETELIRKIKYEGLDPHQATADLVSANGTLLTRKKAKNGNFAYLYGSGIDTLARTIGSSRAEAEALKSAIGRAAPEIGIFVRQVQKKAKEQGVIRNWAGRRFTLDDTNFAYKMPNYLIQGGCADVNKFALNKIDDYLAGKKSRLIMTIHDENPCEVHESEIHEVPAKVREIMESIYPYKFLPLTCGMEWSPTSLGDKKKGYPG